VVRGDSGDGEEEERNPSFLTISSSSSPEAEERASEEWTPRDKRLLTGRKQYPKGGRSLNPSSSSRKKETRGRPATTGDYVGLAEAKERLNAAKREELRLRDIERHLDPTSGPILTAVGRDNLPPRGVFAASLQGVTTLELRRLAGTFSSQVERVAGVFGMTSFSGSFSCPR